MAHILHTESRHRRPMIVRGDLVDVNNPQIHLSSRERPSIANLYELEFSGRQRQLLDRARREADLWKSEGKFSGTIRSAKLQ
jgi:succinylarginine dihydrolase